MSSKMVKENTGPVWDKFVRNIFPMVINCCFFFFTKASSMCFIINDT